VHLDWVKLVARQDLRKLAAFELCAAHPSRNDGKAEAGLDAGDDAFGGGDLNAAFDGEL